MATVPLQFQQGRLRQEAGELQGFHILSATNHIVPKRVSILMLMWSFRWAVGLFHPSDCSWRFIGTRPAQVWDHPEWGCIVWFDSYI